MPRPQPETPLEQHPPALGHAPGASVVGPLVSIHSRVLLLLANRRRANRSYKALVKIGLCGGPYRAEVYVITPGYALGLPAAGPRL